MKENVERDRLPLFIPACAAINSRLFLISFSLSLSSNCFLFHQLIGNLSFLCVSVSVMGLLHLYISFSLTYFVFVFFFCFVSFIIKRRPLSFTGTLWRGEGLLGEGGGHNFLEEVKNGNFFWF